MVARRSGPSHRSVSGAGRPRRGFMMLECARPRFVEARQLANGSVAFYFCIPKYYRKLGCEIANEPLGTRYEAACGENGKGGRAATLNALFDEWNDHRRGEPIAQAKIARHGSVDWLFRQYKTEKAYTEKVSPRSRPDYERIMQLICDTAARAGAGSASGRSLRLRRGPLTRSTRKLSTGLRGSGCDKARRWSASAAKSGASCVGCTRSCSTKSTQTHGMISHSRAAPKARSMRSLATRSTNSHGAASAKASPSRQRLR